ncbi:52 kDa repressor of the inhibitor of the protein kinase-like [Clytia hemisphaerica]|uniref:52 kDa repressor of the inhibitor of the protein kinase-like n=1 Tax=Clytia hemisphaerica TaxID=252671 RepID=UPI0034D3A979
MCAFFNRFEGGKPRDVDVLIDRDNLKAINKAKLILPSIIDTVIVCGHMGIPLRGHRDDRKNYPEAGEYSEKSGLGYGLLSKRATIFSLKVHQGTWYIDEENVIHEEFTGFVHLKDGLTGKAISDTILKRVDDLGLDINQCRGQGFDGAGNVAGHKNGAAALITGLVRKAIFVHCFSHRLNLCVSKNFKIISVSNMLEVATKLTYFFHNSEIRQRCFEKYVKSFRLSHRVSDNLDGEWLSSNKDSNSSSKAKKLRDPSKTRWVERIKDLELFIELFEPLWFTLEEIKNNANRKYNDQTRKDAFSFFKAIDSFDFIVNLVVCYRVLELTLRVTELLQAKLNDISVGDYLITSTVQRVKQARTNVRAEHDEWFQFAVDIANRLNINVSKPRTNKRQIFRDNHPAETVSDYYRVSLTVPLLDTLYQEFIGRFSEYSLLAYKGLYLLPKSFLSEEDVAVKLGPFFRFYSHDMVSPLRINEEIKAYGTFWADFTDLPTTISETLNAIKHAKFDNIERALRILATIPVTTCECERSFSDMKLIKSKLRSTMGQDRLNGLCLMNVHLDKTPDSMAVCEKFLAKQQRRIAK